jgi:branched-chain amino acid transport system ATP-binding protein
MGNDARIDSSLLLEARGLTKRFRGLCAIEDYHLELRGGDILGIIGPNGAGKSTVFNLLSGHIHPDRGSIGFLGRDVTLGQPHRIARAGLGRTFQNIRLFPSMTVLDNVLAARQLGRAAGLFDTLLSTPRLRKTEAVLKDEAMRLLAIFDLESKAALLSTALSYGDQRKL